MQTMNPFPDLGPMMKKLRLSGMNHTLAQRNKQAIDNQLSYTDFFGLLLQDEILRREQSRFSQLIRQAGFQGEKTIENFDFDFNPKINRALVKDLATCRFIEEKAPVLIVGSCGTGKSHLAQALGHCAIRQQHGVIFTNQTQLKQTLDDAKAIGQYQKVFTKLTHVPLLLIDDLGLKPLKPAEEEYLHDLINYRYEQRSTIVTSNLDCSEWQDAFSNKLLGAATIDRLQHGAYQLILEGKSYRAARFANSESTEKR